MILPEEFEIADVEKFIGRKAIVTVKRFKEESERPKDIKPEDYYFLFDYVGEVEKIAQEPLANNAQCLYVKTMSRSVQQTVAIPLEIIYKMDDNVLDKKPVRIDFVPLKDPSYSPE
jgi:hypothetical protein